MLRIDPPRTTAYGALALAAVLAVVAWRTDLPGRVLVVPACLVAVAFGVRDLVQRPVLRADADGLEVVQGWRRLRVPWSQVERMRVVKDRRTPVLELDLGTTLVVLSRTRLGRDPCDVLEELRLSR